MNLLGETMIKALADLAVMVRFQLLNHVKNGSLND